jgi:hypothetical protein
MLFFGYNFEYYSTTLALVLLLQYYNSIGCCTVVPRTPNSHGSCDNGFSTYFEVRNNMCWLYTCVKITGVWTHTTSTKYIFEAVIIKLLFTIFRCVLLLCMHAYVAGIQNKDLAAHTSQNLYTLEASITFRHNFKTMNATQK